MVSQVELRYKNNVCEGCRVEWEFDRFFSAKIITGFDRNKDGNFDAAEIQKIYNTAFTNLKEYGYFVFLRNGAERKQPGKVSEFKAWQKDGVLYYSFFIPFATYGLGNDFYIAVFDCTYYCSIDFSQKPVVFSGIEQIPLYEIIKNDKYPVYYNPLATANDNNIYKKWKPGLATAYPTEIHISETGKNK